MEITKKQRKQLIVNIILMLLTLVTLVTCIVAWFSNQSKAQVDEVSLRVERAELKLANEITLIKLPCATKICDEVTSEEFFNSTSSVVKTYVLYGEGQVFVKVEPANVASKGLLGYVCDVDVTDYYGAIKAALSDEASKRDIDLSKCTFEQLSTMMESINRRAIGTTNSDGDTEFKIVYWAEYGQFENDLNQEEYWVTDNSFRAKLTITGG